MRRLFLFLLALAGLPSLSLAATLSGSATTRVGEPLARVPLKLTGPSGTRTVLTSAAGEYVVSDLPPGDYRVESALPGFVVASPAKTTLTEADARLNVTLDVAAVREHVVVAATRGEAPSSTLGVTVSVLDRDRMAAREALTLTQLLQDLPGLTVNRSGPTGRQTTVFLRGGSSTQTRVLVDGLPVNEPGGFFDYGHQLGLELSEVEVVRGAASSLYGSDALAGVIALRTRRPLAGEATRASLRGEAGGFGLRRYQGGVSGRTRRLDWNASALRFVADNDGPNAQFRETAGALSLGADLGDRWTAHLVARGGDGVHGTPGQTGFGELDLDAYFERTDLLAGVTLRRNGARWRHELRMGHTRSDQLSVNPLDSGAYLPRFGDRVAAFAAMDYVEPAGYQNDTRRDIVGYQGEYEAGAHLLTAGADVERESGELGSRGGEEMLSPTRTNAGLYFQDRWVVAPTVFVTAGARVEHNDSFGTETVPRVAVSWVARGGADSTRLKSSAGAGIKEPGFFESFGTSFFAQGNPDLKAERSRTYDIGVEQRALSGRVRAEVTAFRHDYRDQIAYRLLDTTTFRGTYVNLGSARAQGLELEVEARPRRGLRLYGQYTFMDTEVLVSSSDFDPLLAAGKPLLRRPKQAGSVTAEGSTANGRFTAAATAVFVGPRPDSDFAGLDLTENAGHTRIDGRLRLRASRRLEVFAVGENLLDADYQEILGYPGLGRALRVGVRVQAER
jgi:vitamin B12 transporter